MNKYDKCFFWRGGDCLLGCITLVSWNSQPVVVVDCCVSFLSFVLLLFFFDHTAVSLHENSRSPPSLKVRKPLSKCIDRKEMMQKETVCFPELCPTLISNAAANFKAEEGRKHDSKVSAIPNTVGGKNQRGCLGKSLGLVCPWVGLGVETNDTWWWNYGA